jgi:hypothetical protein
VPTLSPATSAPQAPPVMPALPDVSRPHPCPLSMAGDTWKASSPA